MGFELEWTNMTVRQKLNFGIFMVISVLVSVIGVLWYKVESNETNCNSLRALDKAESAMTIDWWKSQYTLKDKECDEKDARYAKRLEGFEDIVLGLKRHSDSLENKGK